MHAAKLSTCWSSLAVGAESQAVLKSATGPLIEHKLFYYPYASFPNAQLFLLRVAALRFDKLVILDPVGASSNTIGADHVARDAVTLLKDAGILEIITPSKVLARYAGLLQSFRFAGWRGDLTSALALSSQLWQRSGMSLRKDQPHQ